MSGAETERGRDLPEATLLRARLVAAGLAAGTPVLAAVALAAPQLARVPALVAPAALAGLVALPVALRVQRFARERRAGRGSTAERAAAYVTSVALGLAVTEAAAIFGVVAFLLSRHPWCFSGLATHTILVGAIWPSRETVARALAPSDEEGGTP